jgi:hypothetical protein
MIASNHPDRRTRGIRRENHSGGAFRLFNPPDKRIKCLTGTPACDNPSLVYHSNLLKVFQIFFYAGRKVDIEGNLKRGGSGISREKTSVLKGDQRDPERNREDTEC